MTKTLTVLLAAVLLHLPLPELSALTIGPTKTSVLGGLRYRSGPPATTTKLVGGCDDPAYELAPAGRRALRDPALQRVVLNVRGVPSTLSPADVVVETERALRAWNDEVNPCGRADRSPLSFGLVATTSTIPMPADDGENMIMFGDGLCTSSYDVACMHIHEDRATGNLLGWDIVLSTAHAWGIGTGPWLDVRNALVHELGHVVGLEHVGDSLGGCDPAHAFLTMLPCTWPGDTWKRDLALGDALGLEVISDAS